MFRSNRILDPGLKISFYFKLVGFSEGMRSNECMSCCKCYTLSTRELLDLLSTYSVSIILSIACVLRIVLSWFNMLVAFWPFVIIINEMKWIGKTFLSIFREVLSIPRRLLDLSILFTVIYTCYTAVRSIGSRRCRRGSRRMRRLSVCPTAKICM